MPRRGKGFCPLTAARIVLGWRGSGTGDAMPEPLDDAARRGPLCDRCVLDFTTLLPGPLATLLLAEAGAEVVKVERPPGGDDMRGYSPRWGDGDSALFALLNRGKKSVALDLKDPGSRQKLRPLLERADVLVEQFRPGVMRRLSLDYASVAEINPGIIYCSITGYGQSGPKRDAVGHDLNYLGDAGLLSLSHGDAARPVLPSAPLADIAGGSYPAVMNILLALIERQTTETGRHLDIAISEGVFPMAFWALAQGAATGRWPGNGDGFLTGGTPRYALYPTRDGRIVAAAPLEDQFWATFCDLVGLPEALRDDVRDPAATARAVREVIARETGEHWARVFAGRACAATVVRTMREAVEDPHFVGRGVFAHRVGNGGGGTLPALPVPLDPAFRPTPSEVRGAPALGADRRYLEGDAPDAGARPEQPGKG